MSSTPNSRFEIGEEDFLLDGRPFRILSGALHYFRVHPDLWQDRIHKARLMGLNTIETYIAWNEHSPQRGEFITAGHLDIGRFLDLVDAEGMKAIVRPGPYICAEWDGGGLPGWLFGDPTVRIRRSEPRYLSAVAEYFDALLPVLETRQVDVGGPLVLVQIENEYGAYGADKNYLRTLVEMTRERGITVPLTTVDQPTDAMLDDGGLPELLKTGSFGSRSAERLATLRTHQPTGPLMCSEFWDGWFDNWGSHHHVTSVQQSAADLDEILAAGASVNLYMFHGGSNFGFTNGANDKGTYLPIVTSYDYDAPLDELGEPSPKYWAYRDVLAKYATVPDQAPVSTTRPREFSVALERGPALLNSLGSLGTWQEADSLPTLDDVDHYRGFALYRTRVENGGQLEFDQIRDRATFFLDGQPLGTLSRDHHQRAIQLPSGGTLEILVEDQGRVSYGARIGEPKGLIGPATLNGLALGNWSVLPLDLCADLAWDAVDDHTVGPRFYRALFDALPGEPLVLSTRGWGKGVAFVNGFNLGRYWSRGPQATLVVPAPLVQAENTLRVWEEGGMVDPYARFVEKLELGFTEE